MGFRFPLTTAAELDTTGGPGAAGVRAYNATGSGGGGGPVTYGVVAFSDGFGDSDATLSRTAHQNPRTNSVVSDSGGLAITGGSYGGTAAPELDLNVETYQPGSLIPVGRFKGGQILFDRPIGLGPGSQGAQETWAAVPFIAGAWQAFNTSTDNPQMRRDAAGDAHLKGLVQIVTGSGFAIGAGASGTVGTLPSGYFLPGANTRRQVGVYTSSGIQTGLTVATISGTGVLTIYNNTGATWGAGIAFDLGMTYPIS